jgi:hypothetical protein
MIYPDSSIVELTEVDGKQIETSLTTEDLAAAFKEMKELLCHQAIPRKPKCDVSITTDKLKIVLFVEPHNQGRRRERL